MDVRKWKSEGQRETSYRSNSSNSSSSATMAGMKRAGNRVLRRWVSTTLPSSNEPVAASKNLGHGWYKSISQLHMCINCATHNTNKGGKDSSGYTLKWKTSYLFTNIWWIQWGAIFSYCISLEKCYIVEVQQNQMGYSLNWRTYGESEIEVRGVKERQNEGVCELNILPPHNGWRLGFMNNIINHTLRTRISGVECRGGSARHI